MSLCAHGDTKRVTEAEVMAVPAPEFTSTWHPIPHSSVVATLDNALKNIGIGVLNKEYSLNRAGTRMFGSWALDIRAGGRGYELGIRNATDKSMALGLCAGDRVFVCDNLAFTGDLLMFRKHTAGLDHDEMVRLGMNAVKDLLPKMERLIQWHAMLEHKYVPPADFKGLVYDMMIAGVFSPGQFGNYLDCLEAEKKQTISTSNLAGTTTLHTVHGAATRLMKGWNLLRASKSTAVLESLCNDYLDTHPIEAEFKVIE